MAGSRHRHERQHIRSFKIYEGRTITRYKASGGSMRRREFSTFKRR